MRCSLRGESSIWDDAIELLNSQANELTPGQVELRVCHCNGNLRGIWGVTTSLPVVGVCWRMETGGGGKLPAFECKDMQDCRKWEKIERTEKRSRLWLFICCASLQATNWQLQIKIMLWLLLPPNIKTSTLSGVIFPALLLINKLGNLDAQSYVDTLNGAKCHLTSLGEDTWPLFAFRQPSQTL